MENYECKRVVLEKQLENKDPMPLLTLEAVNAVPHENRLKFLGHLCAELSNESLTTTLPPNENSLASEDIKTSQEMLKVLADVETPKQFSEVTESEEMEDIFTQIECITGVNLLTGAESEITEIKIDSPLLNDSVILQKNKAEIEEALRNDIAKLHGVSPKDIFIRKIVSGSIEVYFSLPESKENKLKKKISDVNLLTFNSIMQKNGIHDYSIKQKDVLPDAKEAKKILQDYTRPLIIETKSNGSIITEKFGKFLPVLASLSTNVRVKHNEKLGTLEVHGPPSAKAKVLAYFAEMEDLLERSSPANVVIVEQNEIPKCENNNYYSALWNVLFSQGKEIALKTVNHSHKLQTHTIRFSKRVPSCAKFRLRFRKFKFRPR